jgi:hypothetical protein
MSEHTTILPLDRDGTLYAIRDENGRTIGTGTRQVCEVLSRLINNRPNLPAASVLKQKPVPRLNVRAAIVI